MRKRVILALMLAAVMVVAAGCKLIVKDAEVDRQTPVVEVAGKVFTKGEVTDQVSGYLDELAYYYSTYYGYNIDTTSASVISQAQDDTINSLIRQTVIELKGAEMGLDTLTAEELAAAEASADETYNSYADMVKTYYFADTELTGEELEQSVAEMMPLFGYPTKESLRESEIQNAVQEKLKAEVVKDVTVTEEEVKSRYDEKLAAAKASYESSLPAYGSAARSGETIFFVPEGYRYVKHILRQISDEDSAAISEAEGKVTEAQTRLSGAETSLAGLGEDPAADSAEDAANRAQWTQDKTTAEADLAVAQADADAAREAAYARLRPALDEIKQKLSEGADFDALMAEYGEDPGMQTSPGMEEGYLVCAGDTQWVAEFTEAAMALEKVGDISPEVRTAYGIHILRYESDLPSGEVPLEAVKDAVFQEVLAEKQDEAYEAAVSQWVTDANAKVNKDVLD